MRPRPRRTGLGWVVLVFGGVLACRPSDDPAGRPSAERPTATAAPPASAPPAAAVPTAPTPSVERLPDGPDFAGLVLPEGARVVLEDASGTTFRVPYEASAVAAHIRGQLLEPTSTEPARGITRFARVTPRGADPEVVRLYVLVTPRAAGDAMILVQQLPAHDTPEAAARRVEQFQRDLPTLD